MPEREVEIATIIDDMHDKSRRPRIERISEKLSHAGILHTHLDVVGGSGVELELGGFRYIGEEEISSAIELFGR